MRKKTIGIVICTLVITAVIAPIASSSNISQLQCSSKPEFLIDAGANYAFSKKGSNLDNWGITDSISLGTAQSIRIYYFHKFDIGGSDKGFVKISSNGGSSWDTLWEFQGFVSNWEVNLFDISDYSGKTVLIGFQYVTESESVSQGWSIDKITVNADGENKYEEDFEEYDNNDPWDDWIIKSDLNPENYPPYPPKIEGPKTGDLNKPVTFKFRASDPDKDPVSYYIEWGDDALTDWTEFSTSGSGYNENHTWSEEGTFTIKAKARDINKAESPWTEHKIKISKGRDRQSNSLLFTKLLERLFEQLLKSFPLLNKVIEF